jgi:hypothetical protein
MRLAARQTAEVTLAPLGVTEVFNISSTHLWPGVRGYTRPLGGNPRADL